MNSSLISYTGLLDRSFNAKLAMELNSPRIYVQNTEETKHSTDGLEINSSNVISLGEHAPLGTKNERREFGSSEHIALPTVFEGRITNGRKVSQHEKLSNIDVTPRRSGSNHDVRRADVRPLSPFLSRYVSLESLDHNFPKPPTGVHTVQRKISSPLPTEVKKMCHLSIRGRALSDSPVEALISPVAPRRRLGSENVFNPGQLQGGLSRVKSCPVIKSESNEQLSDLLLPLTIKSSSSAACSTLKPADQDRLPRIHQTHSPMLVRTRKTSNECQRELFNVSPIMDESGNCSNKPDNNSNIQCDFTDKVEYYLYSISVDDDKDSLSEMSDK